LKIDHAIKTKVHIQANQIAKAGTIIGKRVLIPIGITTISSEKVVKIGIITINTEITAEK